MKFPQTIKHRDQTAKIYGRSESYDFYRVAWRVNGKRRIKSVQSYSAAKKEAESIVRDLSKGHQAIALSPKEASDALAVRDALDSFYRETGQVVSPIKAVSEYLEGMKKLGDRSLLEAVDGYLASTVMVKPKQLAQAVEEFSESRKSKAKARNGERAKLNPKYVLNTENWLRDFSKSFEGHLLSDLSKQHLNLYLGKFSKLGAKSRNDRRATLGMFFRWCVRNDYLPANHRLLEADEMLLESLDDSEIVFYRPDELRALLDHTEGAMRAVVALQGLAGLRLDEALRLTWNNIFGIEGHIEVSSSKAKTRQRRLVEICPALEQWLAPYRGLEGRIAEQWQTTNGYVQAFMKMRKDCGIPSRRNGLRRGFATYHFALHNNENSTAALMGNSPRMVHRNYKGLATKAEAEKWFAVTPTIPENVLQIPRSGEAV